MEPSSTVRDRSRGVLLLLGFVLVSSVLGLALTVLDQGELGLLWGMWVASAVASGVFLSGSMAGAVLAYRVTRRFGDMPGLVASGVLQLLVYWISFLWTPFYQGLQEGGAFFDPVVTGPWDALVLVALHGAPGLLFATAAPPFYAHWEDRGDEA